jgi:pyruvate formate lyase activating enzyme
MRDVPPTPPETLSRARAIALGNGLRYAYTGNVHDTEGGSTRCPSCDDVVVERDWYVLGRYRLSDDGRCQACGTQLAGRFAGPPGAWGARRVPVRLSNLAAARSS